MAETKASIRGNSTVRWALVGASSWADHTFGPAISSAPSAIFHGVASSRPARAVSFARKHEVKHAFGSFEEMVADERIDAVWIATPNHMHREQTVQALNAGKHVLVEKPMGLSVTECEEMRDAAQRAGRLLSVGYHARQHPVHQDLRRRFKAGEFGEPQRVRAQLYTRSTDEPPAWRRKRATSGGWALSDIGTHMIDLLRWFLGPHESVYGELSNRCFGFETDDHALVTVRFGSGAIGTAEAAHCAPSTGLCLEVYGSERYAVCRNTFFGKPGSLTVGRGGAEPEVSVSDCYDLYQREVESFSRAVLGAAPLAVTADDGIENVRIMQEARGY